MSNVVDNRIVEMRFDNSNFENNVSTSMNTLERLKNALNFKNNNVSINTGNLGNLQSSIDSISGSVSALEGRFSTLGIVGMTAISNLTTSAMGLVGKLGGFVKNSIIGGGISRAVNLENAHFQMLGLLKDEKKVEAVMTNVQDAVDGTAYGLDSAAKVAAQFTASGIKAGDGMYKSLRAVAGVAAMTNASYDEIGQVFTRVAGQGRVMAVDLYSLSARGLNAAATLGEYLGKTEGEIRDMVSKGKIDFQTFSDAMDSAFGEHAKAANETVNGTVANIKSAFGRIGALFISPLIKQNGPLVKLLNTIRDKVNDIKTAIEPLADAVTQTINGIFVKLNSFISKLNIKGGATKIFTAIDKFLAYLNNSGITNAANRSEAFKKKLEDIKKIFTSLKTIISAVGSVVSKVFSVGFAIVKSSISIIGKLAAGFGNILESVVNLGSRIKESASNLDFFGKIAGNVKTVVSSIASSIKTIANSIADVLSKAIGDIASLLEKINIGQLVSVLNSGILLTALTKFLDIITVFKSPVTNIGEILNNTINSIAGIPKLNATTQTIRDVGIAIGILAVALLLLSTIDPDKLAKAMAALTLVITELFVAISKLMPLTIKSIPSFLLIGRMLVKLGESVILMAAALKILSTIDIEHLASGLASIAAMLVMVGIFIAKCPTEGMKRISSSMVPLAISMVILASAMKILSSMNIKEVGTALLALAGSLLIICGALKIIPSEEIGRVSFSLILISTALVILSAAMKQFGQLSLKQIGKSILTLGSSLIVLATAMRFMKGSVGASGALLVCVAALALLVPVLKSLGSMKLESIVKGLGAIGGAIAILATGLYFMKGSVAGSAALLIASVALLMLGNTIKKLGSLSWKKLIISLVALAGAFAIIGIAGVLLAPIIPAILALAGAFMLLGVGMIGIGAGLALVGVGLTSIVAALVAFAGSARIFAETMKIMWPAAVEAALLALQAFVSQVGTTVVMICDELIKVAPKIAETILSLISQLLIQLNTYIPQIVDSLITFFISILDGLSARMPEIVESVKGFIDSLVEAITASGVDISPESALKIIKVIGVFGLVLAGLSVLKSLIPGAMIALAEMGLCVAEIAAIVAAFGLINQIPGFSWLISEGGNLLQAIGTALGQFVGGLIGGIGKGLTASMPEIATNLSTFMTNLQPFIAGAMAIDPSILGNIAALSAAIIAITAADFISSIISFVTGGADAITNFSTQIVSLGSAIKAYSDEVSGVDAASITASVVAIKGLVNIAKVLNANKSGGIFSLFTGKGDSLSSFASDMGTFGTALKDACSNLSGIDSTSIDSATTAVEKLVAMMKKVETVKSDAANGLKESINKLSTVDTSALSSKFSNVDFSKVGSQMSESISKGLSSAKSSINSATSGIISSITKSMSSAATKMKTAGKTLGTNLASGFKSSSKSLVTNVKTVCTSAASAASGYKSKFKSAGANMGQGLADGILSKKQTVKNAVNSVANYAKTTITTVFQIKSPSRVTYKFGEYISQGLANGISSIKSLHRVGDASGSLAKTALNSMSSAIASISDMVSNDIDANPVITPVVDLDNVRKGANSISSMFNSGYSLAAAGNIGSINTMFSRNRQNGNINDVLSAINKMSDELGKTGNTYNSIGDISYGDDTMVSEAIGTLVHAVKIGKRM